MWVILFQLRYLGEAIGWGVFSLQPLPANTIVAEYVGELITSAEKKARLEEYEDPLTPQREQTSIMMSDDNRIMTTTGEQQRETGKRKRNRQQQQQLTNSTTSSRKRQRCRLSLSSSRKTESYRQLKEVDNDDDIYATTEQPLDPASTTMLHRPIATTVHPAPATMSSRPGHPSTPPITTKKRFWYIMEVAPDLVIDSERFGNISRFMNHSCEPNCQAQKWKVGKENRCANERGSADLAVMKIRCLRGHVS